jgi:hypothetical protein
MACLVRAVAGGDLLTGLASNNEPHYWNRLPDGHEIDLTSDQYGGDGYLPITTGSPVEAPEPAPLRSLLFAMAVHQELAARNRAAPRLNPARYTQSQKPHSRRPDPT